MRGIRVPMDGEEIYFVPIELGPKGNAKTDAMDAMLEAERGENGMDWGDIRRALHAFAITLLEQNYGREQAEEIADRIPLGWGQALVGIATQARVPADFFEGGRMLPG